MKAKLSRPLAILSTALIVLGALVFLIFARRESFEDGDPGPVPRSARSEANPTGAQSEAAHGKGAETAELSMNKAVDDSQAALAQLDEEWAKRGFVVDRQTKIQADLGSLKRILQDYYRALGEFPEGDSDAIVRGLKGENKQKAIFLSSEATLADPWKTPYQFSREGDDPFVEVRSAGPDKSFWSSDDIVSRIEAPRR